MTQKNDQLFGVLAVRTGMISAKALAAAESKYPSSKSADIGEFLQHQGELTEETRKLLESLVEKHLEMHSNDFEMSLATLNPSKAQPSSPLAKNVSALEDTVNFDRDDIPRDGFNTTPPLARNTADANKTQWSLSTAMKDVSQRYLVLRSHAKGGMGLVSIAKDKEIDREVAFKELQEYCADDSNSRARFIQEAEITGQLEHPGVVPIYGLGAYPDGRPYYAMRFVQGESLGQQIAEFHETDLQHQDLSQGGLSFRALLGRFVDVCNAIAYAHSRGVLHRDLKPDNIMLGKFGETLVVDWGLAKAIGRKEDLISEEPLIKAASGEGSTATRMGSATGTPAYMSPEQASGQLDRLSPASDVYSLGATLYCLLTGQAPIAGDSLTEVLRKAQLGEFQLPRLVNPRVPATMNSICCRAMSTQPADRYQSPLELAADIECWLSDEAVTAHQENLWEKSSRWFRRHRAWALAGAATLAVVAAVAAFSAFQINAAHQKTIALAIKERAAKQHATARFKQSRDTVDTWLTGFSEALSDYPGVQKFRERMLLRAAADYEQFVATEETDREMEIERGRALLRLGDVRHILKQNDEADKAYNEAESVFAKMQDDGGGENIPLVELPQTMLRKAILAAELGKTDQAIGFYRHAIERGLAIIDFRTDEKIAHIAVADARSRLGLLLAAKGKGDEANDLLQISIVQQKKQVEQSPDSLDMLVSLADTRIALGQLLAQRSEISLAQQEFETATGYYQTLLSKQQDNPAFLESKARALILLATTHRMAGRWDLETEAYQQAIMDYQALIKAMPDVPVHRENLALTQTDLGQLLRESFRPSEAVEKIAQARTVVESLSAKYPSVVRFHEERATCLDNLGEALFDLGQYSESLDVHKKAEDIFRELVANVPSIVQYRQRHAISRSHLGLVYHALEQQKLAEKEFLAALELLEKYLEMIRQGEGSRPESYPTLKSLAIISEYYGDLLFADEQTTAACQTYQGAKEYWAILIERSPLADYFHRAAEFHVMCRCESIRDASLAVEYASMALEAAPTNALYQGTLAAAHYRNQKFALTVSLATEALRNSGGNRGRDYLFLAMAQHHLGQASKAKTSLAAAAAWQSENVPGNLRLSTLHSEATQLQADTSDTSKTP